MRGKLLITGGRGFVAGHILRSVPLDYEIYVLSREENPIDILQSNVRWIRVSKNSYEEWGEVIEEVKPTTIIHTSAMADIDQCQKDKQTAYSVNVELTKVLVKASEKCRARFIFCSSDTVFDGNKGMYTEEDTPIPVNYYAETKIESEKLVLNSDTPRVVARISLVMGFPAFRTIGNSFMARMEQKIKSGEPVPMPQDEYRTPIDVYTLSEALVELALSSDYEGILHLSGNERISRYNMAIMICEEMNWDKNCIVPSIVDNPTRAPRPKDASLNNSRARAILKTEFLNVVGGIRRLKEEYLRNK
ncbi:MAG: NAD(P)-dependent oxidoreductase [Candidatus Hydrogenedentes bacterium]|nr:NAD(P)-dependent oxidoreductase [Candidatus Hydrogenedentota bacterium]